MYRRTVLGWLWLFINPLFPVALRAVIFGGLLGVGSDGLPYFLFLLAGTVIWEAFATGLMWGTRALEMNRDLSGQVYHPRAILPLGNMTPSILNLGLKVGVFAVALVYYTLRVTAASTCAAMELFCGPLWRWRWSSCSRWPSHSLPPSWARIRATCALGSGGSSRCGTC